MSAIDPRRPDRRCVASAGDGGFTLIEMLVALSILTVGVTTLLLALGDSMALRRSTDARLAAAVAVEGFLQRIEATGVRRRVGSDTDLDLELVLPDKVPLEGGTGVSLSAKATDDERLPGMWLVTVTATWLDHGDLVTEEFQRVLPRQLPLGTRVQRFRARGEDPGAGHGGPAADPKADPAVDPTGDPKGDK